MRERLQACVEAWPECVDGAYDPRCCRFPKSCSCEIFEPDLKPAPRVEDRSAMKRKLLQDPWCRACGRRASNCHHIIGKAQGGDDDLDNLAPLCGSGSSGCHGALHGNPYTAYWSGRRWDARDVRLAIGLSLTPSEYGYVVGKLGAEPAQEYLRLRYFVEIASWFPYTMKEAA